MMLARRVVTVTRTSTRAMSSVWSHLEMGPPDPILGVTEAFKVPPRLPHPPSPGVYRARFSAAMSLPPHSGLVLPAGCRRPRNGVTYSCVNCAARQRAPILLSGSLSCQGAVKPVASLVSHRIIAESHDPARGSLLAPTI